jgi:hypothetical protein
MPQRATFVKARPIRPDSRLGETPPAAAPAWVRAPAPIGLALLACLLLRLIGLAVDPAHRPWLPVSLLQGRESLFIGELIIGVILLAAIRLMRRLVAGNEWEEALVLSVAVASHLQLLAPWGRVGAGHMLFSLIAFTAYSWLLFQAAYRNRSLLLLVWGGAMVGLTLWCITALRQGSVVTFGVLEHVVIGGLLVGFRLYDREHVSLAIQRESSPRTCRYNNLQPPFLLFAAVQIGLN